MSQMNPKEVFDNTAYSVQLPYIAGHSLKWKKRNRATETIKVNKKAEWILYSCLALTSYCHSSPFVARSLPV